MDSEASFPAEIPFRPVDPEHFRGHPMPPTVPPGMRLELSRAKLLDGAEAEFEDWMRLLNDRAEECRATLAGERMAFECTFLNREADGSWWMYHLQYFGEEGGRLDTSTPIDAEHLARARRTKHPGWEELAPRLLLVPDGIGAAMSRFGASGRED